jgi:putative flippase GtrA
MDAARDLANRLHLPTTFVKFLIVGGLGFMISQFVLFLIYDADVVRFLPSKHTEVAFGLGIKHPDILLLIGSIIAVEAAIVFQFNAHERWTFWHRRRSGWAPLRFLKFNVSSAVSPIIIVVTVNILTPVFGFSPYLASGIGVLIGFSWNWTWNSMVIWPQHKQDAAMAE